MNIEVCKKMNPSYYLIYEKPHVLQFLRKRYSDNYRLEYKWFIKHPDDLEYDCFKITIENTFKDDISRLDDEIDLINHILLRYPFVEDLAKDYLIALENLKRKYNSLLRKSIKAIEDYKNQKVEEQGEKEPDN